MNLVDVMKPVEIVLKKGQVGRKENNGGGQSN
jgi:hypothetical protein